MTDEAVDISKENNFYWEYYLTPLVKIIPSVKILN